MAADFETIKDYLIGLGFSVNQQQLKKFTSALEDVGKKVQRSSSSMGSTFAKAGGAMVATITSIVGATALMMDKVAKADMGYQLYGMKMLMATDTAKKFKIAIDTLGYSMEEIAFNPELNKRFNILIQDQIRLQETLPKNFKTSMFNIREIGFQFDRLKVKLLWFFDGLSSKLSNVLGLSGAQGPLEKLNDWFEKKIPRWTDNIVGVIEYIKGKWSELTASFDSTGINAHFEKMRQVFGQLKKDWDGINGTTLAWEGFKNMLQGISLAFISIGKTAAAAADVYVRFAAGDFKGAVAAGLKIFDFSDALPRGVKEWQSFFRGERGLDFSKTKGMLKDDWDAFGKLKTWEQMQKEVANKPSAQNLNDRIKQLAIKTSKKTGIPADLIYGQWSHETGGFNDIKVAALNNLGGIRVPGGLKYRKFESLDDFANYYSNLMLSKRYEGVTSAKNPQEFASALKKGGYYEDTQFNYEKGIERFSKSFNSPPTTTTNSVSVGDVIVNVGGSNASPKEIGKGVIDAIQKQLNVQNLYRQNEFAGVYR